MNKNVLYVTLLLGGGIYLGYDTYFPEYEKWETEIADLQKKIDTAKQNAPKLAGLKKDEQELKRRLRSSLSQLPSGAELENLLIMVLPLLEECGIQSQRISTQGVEPAQLQAVYRIHPIKIGGIKDLSMQTIVEVLHKIRSFQRIINAKSVLISRSSKDRYTLTMDLETYSYIETEGEDLGLDEPPADETPVKPAEEAPAEPASGEETSIKDTAAAAGGAEGATSGDTSNSAESVATGAGDSGASATGAVTDTAATEKLASEETN